MDGIWKFFALAIFSAMIAVAIKKQSPEFALLLAICAGLGIFGDMLGRISAMSAVWRTFLQVLPEGIPRVLLKETGLCVLTKLTAEVCRDCEQKALAAAVELCGMAAGFFAAMPLYAQVFGYIEAML